MKINCYPDTGSLCVDLSGKPNVEAHRKRNQGAIDLLNQWSDEDATDDLNEMARREADWQDFKKGMNENSLSGRISCPAEDYP